jgi:hypothetical protein
MGNGSIIAGSFEALPQAGGTAYRSIASITIMNN